MDTATLIISAILLAICILPFILISRNRKKNEQGLMQSLQDEAQKVNCTIQEHEFCCNMMIGLDKTNNTIFFIKKTDVKCEQSLIVLSGIKQCELLKTLRSTHEPNQIEKLALNFISKDDKVACVVLNFYDSNERFQMNGELQMIEKWHKIIVNKLEQ